jgi:16S rRNA processing protein RimM
MSDQAASAHNTTGTPEHLIVGQVVAPFGVRGELKVNILTEFPDRFKRTTEIVLAPFGSIEPGHAPTAALDPATARSASAKGRPVKPLSEKRAFRVEASNVYKDQVRLKLEGVESADEAEALRGCWVLVRTDQAQHLPSGSYYIYQLVGLDVVSTSGDHIGQVTDVLTMSANDIYVVKGPGVNDPSGELLVPAVKAIVSEIDLSNRRVVIAPPEDWA